MWNHPSEWAQEIKSEGDSGLFTFCTHFWMKAMTMLKRQ
jgi:hypothetical protein